MKKTLARKTAFFRLSVLGVGLILPSLVAAAIAADDEGFAPIFDGKTLDGWDGNPAFWRVEQGTIIGETTAENPTKGNTFIIWRGGRPSDFELKVEYRMRNHNSGVQVRSFEKPEEWGKWVVGGYQSDIAENERYHGILYGERFRGILCMRGDKALIGDDHKPKVVGKIGDSKELAKHIKSDGWNEYHIVCKDNVIKHSINGQQMIELTDNDTEMRRSEGLIALQLHAGPPMQVQFRNIRLKEIPAADQTMKQSSATKKVVFIAGPKSHGYNGHEHYAGCMLLAKCLEENVPEVEATVVKDGWPKDPAVLENAQTIVIFCDGGGRHVMIPHMDQLGKLMDRGVSLVCLHYGVEAPKGKPGDALLAWTGGYFETHWSVNPYWTAKFTEFPDHPVSRGVTPFEIDDEWYYHMRFPEGMKGVTPILTAIPPDKTRERPDGAHSGNPVVRSRKGMPEHLLWVTQRADGGRGMGFTGGHWHYNWANDSFRTAVLNGIVWATGLEVPADGVPSKTPTVKELKVNQDYPEPANYDWQKIGRQIDEWNK